jgi:hypothetical protein
VRQRERSGHGGSFFLDRQKMGGHCAGAQRQSGIAAQSRKIDGAGQNHGRGRAMRRATREAVGSTGQAGQSYGRRAGGWICNGGPAVAAGVAAGRTGLGGGRQGRAELDLGWRHVAPGWIHGAAATHQQQRRVDLGLWKREREREEGRSLARYHVRGSVNGSSALLHGPKCQIYKSSLQRGPYRKGKRKTLYISNNGILGNMHLVKQLIIRATETHNIMQYLGQQEIFWHS